MPRNINPATYILANQPNGTLYIGVTSNLLQRVWQHRNHCVAGHTQTYHVTQLVHYEQHSTMLDAIAREKQLKAWLRAWKIALIEANNPQWLDLYDSIV